MLRLGEKEETSSVKSRERILGTGNGSEEILKWGREQNLKE